MFTTIALSVVGYRATLFLVKRYMPAGKAKDVIVRALGGGGPIEPL